MSPEVRTAAEALKAAIDRHLEACADKRGEQDEAVRVAFLGLREAAETYEDALYDAYDEVTPFEFSRGPMYEPAEVAQPGVPERVTVLQRGDFAVSSAEDLVAAGRRLLQEDGDDDEELSPVESLAVHLEVYGLDETASAADEVGLRWLGGTTWVLDQDVEDDTLRSAPFAAADPARLLHRFDEEVSAG
jgi:hypothetical protein